MQHKMDEHAANVQDFQSMMSSHFDWINNAEQALALFKHPSKLVERVLQQIDEHKVCWPHFMFGLFVSDIL